MIPGIRSKSKHVWLCSFSTISETKKTSSSKPHSRARSEVHSKTLSTEKANSSLFNEIIEILGSENLKLDRIRPGNFISKEPIGGIADEDVVYGQRIQGVRQNADEKLTAEVGTDTVSSSTKRDAQMEISCRNDVSPVVQKIAEIVRAENIGISMEKCLDDGDLEIDPDIVDKVLKRCFKVPGRAMRFFNWVKLRSGSCFSTEVYNTMLYIAGEAKEFGLVENLMKEMEERKCLKNVKTWTIVLMQYGKAKLIGKTLLMFDKMNAAGCEPDAGAYRVMIRLLSASGKGEIALHLYNEMAQKDLGGLELDIKTYKLLLNCLAVAGDIDGVYSVADGMINSSHIPESEVYSFVLKSFCISKRIQNAFELIHHLQSKKDFTFNPEYFETLVKGLCKADRINDAVEILGIMKKRGVVDEKVYGTIISGHLRKKEISKALALFHNMKESGLLPATSTYTELMHYHFNLNEYEKGSAMFEEMVDSGIELDSVAFMPIIAAHVRRNRVSLAWKVFETMEERGIRATQKSYSVFIKELCKISMTEEVFKVLNKMQKSKVNMGDEIYHLVTCYLERIGEIVKAEEVKEMHRLCRFRFHPLEAEEASNRLDVSLEETHNTVIHEPKLPQKDFEDEDLLLHKVCLCLSSSKDWHAMEADLFEFEVGYTPSIVMEIMRKCGSQHGSAVLHFFSWVGRQPGYRHTSETYNSAIKIAGLGKDFKHMRSLFHEMKRNGCLITSDTWTIMIMLYGRVGLTDIALRNFTEMKKAAGPSGVKPTASTYKYLILSLCARKRRKVDVAIELFNEMMTVGLAPDKELVEIYLDCLCGSEKLVDARRCVQSLIGNSSKVGFTFTVPLCYSLLIRPLCRRGMVEEALALVDEVKEEEDQSALHRYVCGSLVHGLLQRGRSEEALAKVESLKQAGIRASAHVYTSLMVHFFKENRVERALDIFRKMWEEEEDCHCRPTVVTCTALLCGLLNAGRNYFADAQNLFRRMRIKGPLPDFKAYSTFITMLCSSGKSEYALQLLSEMLDDGIVPSNVNFRTVFFGLNREGKQHLARVVMQQKQALIRKRKF
ncbi:hypothetical protein Dimus_032849 [Dionaea muscipula]